MIERKIDMNETNTSWLKPGGGNLFQEIKAVCAKAEAAGKKLYKLSIGQPSGSALHSAQKAAAHAILSNSETMHSYQDNGSDGVPGFARRFVECHLKTNINYLREGIEVDFLPIPGIKPMLGLIPLACGASEENRRVISVCTTTKPGYPTPSDWCGYLNQSVLQHRIELNPENNFRFNPASLLPGIKARGEVVMMNYPHNPSGQVASAEWLRRLCHFCRRENVRIFNDAAYSILTHTPEHRTLTDIALEFPGLSWAEAFSASKAGNFTGWRIGAMAGSPDFIGDIARIKGNTDSGLAAPLAAGVLHAFENDRTSIEKVRKKYELRLALLVNRLGAHGMRLAVTPQAGFFSLWIAPTRAFGEKIQDARHFNLLMIERTGVVGVHFHPYIRYAVCGDVEAMLFDIDRAFAEAKVSYDEADDKPLTEKEKAELNRAAPPIEEATKSMLAKAKPFGE